MRKPKLRKPLQYVSRTLVIVFAVVGMFASCTKKPAVTTDLGTEVLTPEQVVEKFVRLSAGAQTVDDRGRLRDMCQGKLRQAFEKMSQETFQMSYLSGGVVIETFKIISQKSDGSDAVVRYKVSVHNKQGMDVTQEVNEREVSLVRVNGLWYLDSIRPAGKDQLAFVNGMMF